MGINNQSAEFIISGMRIGVVPGRVCTLGRLNLFASSKYVRSLIKSYGVNDSGHKPLPAAQHFGEELFKMLGFTDCHSMDVSDYEKATILHDLNIPIPETLKGSFDLVFDGGTLEHVFNYPTALKSAMEMVAVGGSLMIATPINNLCGHGFYQFSPELFFRALSKENGFKIVRAFVDAGERKPLRVVDPVDVHGRVQLVNDRPTQLMVHAVRTHVADIFAAAPQQSDYVDEWQSFEKQDALDAGDGRMKAMARKRLGEARVTRISAVLNRLRQKRAVSRFYRESTLSNRRLYKLVDDWTVVNQ